MKWQNFLKKKILENKDMVFKNGRKIYRRMVYDNVCNGTLFLYSKNEWYVRLSTKAPRYQVSFWLSTFKVSRIASLLKLLFMQKWMMREIHKSAKHKIIRFLFSFQVRVIFKLLFLNYMHLPKLPTATLVVESYN